MMAAVNSPRQPLHDIAILLALAAAYWLGASFISEFSGGTGARWAAALGEAGGLPPHAAPVLLSAIGAFGLIIIALPLAGIMAMLYPRRLVLFAVLIAIPATVSLLADVFMLWRMGLQIPAAARALIALDAAKTLLIPAVLALAARRWLPPCPSP